MTAAQLPMRWLVVALCLSLTWLAACGASNEPSDQALTESVAARLNGEPEIAPFDLDVEVDEGVVKLDGTVDSESQRMEAERIARSTAGVRGVTNEIDVASSPRGGAMPPVGAPPQPAPPGGAPGSMPPEDVD